MPMQTGTHSTTTPQGLRPRAPPASTLAVKGSPSHLTQKGTPMAIYLRGKSYYYDFVHKGQRYTGCFGPVSRTVAKEEEARKKAEVLEQRLNPAKARKSPRFDVFAEEYLEWVTTNRRPETCRRLASLVPRLGRFSGQKKLSALPPWPLEQYKKHRREADKQPSTINAELAALNALLRRAQEWGKLVDHPGKAVKPLR